MDAVWQKLLENSILGFVIVALRYLDIQDRTAERKERDTNAKEKAEADRQSNQNIARSYAEAMNTLAKALVDSTTRMENSMNSVKDAVIEKYNDLGITKDVLEKLSRVEQATKQRR